jgi:hypothetical protein
VVVTHAATEGGPPPPPEAPDADWVARFFGVVQDVSAEEMQALWGKILAGEIRHPGRLSLRTLDILRNLTTAEAKVFTSISGCVEQVSGVLLFSSRGSGGSS